MIDIYRLGWYGGMGARKMMPAVTQPGVQQAVPLPDPVTGLIECQWNRPYTLSIPYNVRDPTDWASGVYLAKLTAMPSGKRAMSFSSSATMPGSATTTRSRLEPKPSIEQRTGRRPKPPFAPSARAGAEPIPRWSGSCSRICPSCSRSSLFHGTGGANCAPPTSLSAALSRCAAAPSTYLHKQLDVTPLPNPC